MREEQGEDNMEASSRIVPREKRSKVRSDGKGRKKELTETGRREEEIEEKGEEEGLGNEERKKVSWKEGLVS